MKIGISARGLNIVSGGTKEYIRKLTEALLALDGKNDYYIYYSEDSVVGSFQFPNAHEVVIRSAPNFIWDQYLLPKQMAKDGIDVALFLKNVIPFWRAFKTVVAELDMAYFMDDLNAYKFGDTLYMKLMIPWSIRHADAVLAISQNTKDDILKMFQDVRDEKVTVTYLAPAYTFVSAEDSKRVAEKYSLEHKYIFMSSSLSPRKNIRRALEALALIKDEIPHKFVITGGKAWNQGDIWDVVERLGIKDRFVVLGFVEDEDMPGIYANADLYLQPSLYEGFSMTILEAFAANCPVVASDVSSHPEVVGEAGLLFDPYSVEAMAKAIKTVALDEVLKNKLVDLGQEQLKKFSWSKTASETLSVLERA